MTIGQMISKQKDGFNSVNLNYTDENGISWHIQLPFEKIKSCDAIMQCTYQTFKETYCGKKNAGIFDVVSSNLPENITQKLDFVFPKTSQPARKSDSECNEITVQDYIHARNDVKRIKFGLNTLVGCWYTDTVDVQEPSELMNSLENLFVNNAGFSLSDSSVLNVYLLTREREDWREERKAQQEQDQKDMEKQEEVEKMFTIAELVYLNIQLAICLVGGIIGWLLGWQVSSFMPEVDLFGRILFSFSCFGVSMFLFLFLSTFISVIASDCCVEMHLSPTYKDLYTQVKKINILTHL